MSAPPTDTLLPGETSRRTHATGLPPDLLAQSATRLRVMALLYAFVFFMSDPLAVALFPDERAFFFSSALRWAPSTISISVALIVAALTWSPRIPVATVLAMGLVFEVAGSFGIATAQMLDVNRWAIAPPWAGLSWVAPWMIGFTVMVPSPPRRALFALLCSAAAVPLTIGFVMATEAAAPPFGPLRFVFTVVMPYLLVALIAYVASRVVYALGTEVTRARELGSYRLVRRLGQGGMGEVWEARHRLLARPAAVKLMRPEMLVGSSPARQAELRARFEREAQATASLRSPHTIELYDFGVAADGTFYYVMEFLDGFDLETLVQKFGPVPPERAVHVLTQVCHSLAEAHAEGLIHRDIKPANVYVCRQGREVDVIKVLDFGLVKTHGEAGITQVNLTQDVVGGTPAFMAPEQVLGEPVLDARSDLYSVGCLAYWLVTGELVFQGRTAMETLVQHTTSAPVRPSQRTELPIPDAFERLVLECLEKSPADRPASADLLSARLEAIRMDTSWTRERARQWWDVHHPPHPPS